MNKKLTFVCFSLLILGAIISFAEEPEDKRENEPISLYESSYTSIDQKDCHTLESDNLGSIQECESFADMKVTVIEGDVRQSITLTRNERQYELKFWNMLSSGFSALGLELEWRYKHNQFDSPLGLIVNLEVNEDEENMEAMSSYLIVSKIREEDICIVSKVPPQKDQHLAAQKILESPDELPCLKSLDFK